MSKNYDNWERLVAAVLRRDQLRQIAMNHSRNPSTSSSSPLSSSSSSFNNSGTSQIDESLLLCNQQGFQLFAANWERFLTPYDQQIISTSPYLKLFIDERTGKKCYMVGARELQITWGDTLQYWKWTSHPDSRFPEVAELEHVWWLDIRGKIKTRMLSCDTIYAAVLVFKFAETAAGLGSANAIVRFVDSEPDKQAEKRALTVRLQPAEDITGQTAVSRDDGWMEVEIGKFYVNEGDDEDVEGRLLETRHWKTGLIVEGIEFRPTHSEVPFVLRKHADRRRQRGVIPNFRSSK